MSAATDSRLSTASRGARAPRFALYPLVKRYGLVAALVIVFVFFSFYGPTSAAYPTHANIVTVLGNQTVGVIIAIAAVVPLLAGVLDLSVGATAGLSSIVVAGGIAREGLPAWLAIVLGVLSGAIVGAINGWLITRFNFDPIIETLAMSLLITGLCTWYTDGTPVAGGLPKGFTEFGSLDVFGVPRLMIVLVIVIVMAWYVTEHTPFGRGLAAIGSNRSAARLVGIRVDRTIAGSLAISGLLAGVAGVLLTARAQSADTATGPSYLFPALAAVFLGATAIKPGFPNVLGTVIGAFFVAFTVSGLNIAGTSLWAPSAFNGAALLVALWVMMTNLGARRTRRSNRAPHEAGP